jgi:hypothetical protein
MASAIAWLDFSEEEQRRAREIVQLFSQNESRDELGIGTVRDSLSDAMFPGMSVIQTRARYFLFVPWLFREGERRGYRGPALIRWVDNQERKLIEALRRGGEGGVGDGLIGRVAGVRLKILPSTIYWNGLHRFGILRRSGSIEQLAGSVGHAPTIEEAVTEMVDRGAGIWDPNLPAPPVGFFQLDEASLTLEPAEAEWLAERIEASCAGTLLSWLVAGRRISNAASLVPWDEPAVLDAPPEISRVLDHAELFSRVMHGAALLYNLLLAERCREIGLDELAKKRESLRVELSTWAIEMDALGPRLGNWALEDFWGLVRSINPRVPLRTRLFIDEWIAVASSDQRGELADDTGARRTIRTREQTQKRGQSRLVNDRLLRQWGGEAGLAPLAYRWPIVRRVLGDIKEGRAVDAGA